MAYLDLMQSGMSNMAQAGEAGRRDADSMAGPLNGAIGDISGGLGELTNLPGVSSADAAKLQRAMRGIETVFIRGQRERLDALYAIAADRQRCLAGGDDVQGGRCG